MAVKYELNLSKHEIDFIINHIKYIIKKYGDLNKHDQYSIFSRMCKIPLLKNEFFEYREKTLNILKDGFNIDDEKMHYYVSTELPHTHLEMTEAMKNAFHYWNDMFVAEIKKEKPNMEIVEKCTHYMMATSERAGKLMLGTPIMVWVQKKARIVDKSNKTISIKNFDAELNINKYDKGSNKTDSLTNGSTAPSSSTSITEFGKQSGQDGGSVRLSGTGQGQHIQNSSSSSVNEGRDQGTQGSNPRRKTEKLF